MKKENVNEVKTAAPSAKVVNRRGIGSARGTTRLKFTHELAQKNGLFLAHLDSVTVTKIRIGEETTGMPSFNGMEIPRIVFTFATNEADASKRHYVSLQFTAVESNSQTIPGGKEEWKVNNVFDWFKHILNVFVFKGRELTEEEDSAYSLPFMDFDEAGEYVSLDPQVVVDGWTTLFTNVANTLNSGNNGGAYFTSKDGKILICWIKLLRYIKNNKKGWQPVNNGDLAFPVFVGEGCIELYKQNTPTSIRVDSVKEAIIPMNIQTKAKTPNMPNPVMGGSPAMGGVPVSPLAPMGDDFGAIAEEASEDMPF